MLAGLCLLLCAGFAAAQPSDEPDPEVEVKLLGGYRVGLQMQDAFPMDVDGETFDQSVWLDHRLRFHPQLRFGRRVLAGFEVDLLTGTLGGDLPDMALADDERLRWQANGAQYAEIRQLYIRIATPGDAPQRGLLELGLVTDHWGLGAVANDGGPAAAGFTDSPFGTDHFGDRVLRVGVELLPPRRAVGGITAQLVLDMVARDDHARLFARGDMALRPGIRVLYDEPLARAGLWVNWRVTRQTAGTSSEVLQADVFLDRTLPCGRSDGELRLAFETVGQVGRTTLENGWPDLGRRLILAGAAIGELELDLAGLGPVIGLRGGIASGDADPMDGEETELRLDRDLNAGVILFDEVLAAVSARQAEQVYQLTGSDGAPLANEGAIAGAAFALPYVAFRPHPFVDLRVGGLVAAAAVDPVHIGQVDSVAAGIGGEALERGQRFLGGEIDASVQLDMPLLPTVQPRTRFALRVEYGHLFPGPALTDGWNEPVGRVDRLALHMGLTF